MEIITSPVWYKDDKAILANSFINYKNQPYTTEICNFGDENIEIKYRDNLGVFETAEKQSIIELKDDPQVIMAK